MNSTKFRDVVITPDSYQHDDLPGVWWPHASLQDAETLKDLEPVAHHQHESTQIQANAVALLIAKQRICAGMHR